jgi:hypothetical protein
MEVRATMGGLYGTSGFTRRTLGGRAAVAVLALGCTMVACGGVTPPPRLSAVSPADASAPEAAVPPAAPLLAGERPAVPPAPKATSTPSPSPEAKAPLVRGGSSPAGRTVSGTGIGVRGGFRADSASNAPPAADPGKAAAAPAPQQTYTCPMHPKVAAPQPGSCPDCGMRLVQTKAGAAHP